MKFLIIIYVFFLQLFSYSVFANPFSIKGIVSLKKKIVIVYNGYAMFKDKKYALIKIDNKTLYITENEKIEDIKILKITTDFLLCTNGNKSFKIFKEMN